MIWAPRDRSRQPEHGHTIFLTEEWIFTQSSRQCLRRKYKKRNQEAHQQRYIHEEKIHQQQRDHRNLFAEASFLASQLSPQLNAEFGADYDPSAERDEFHKVQIEQFAFQAEEMMVEKNLDEETIHTPY